MKNVIVEEEEEEEEVFKENPKYLISAKWQNAVWDNTTTVSTLDH